MHLKAEAELERLAEADVPGDVKEAASRCLQAIKAGVAPARDLMEHVTRWIGKQSQQDRYGK